MMSPDAREPASVKPGAKGSGRLISLAGTVAPIRLIVRRDRIVLPIGIMMPALLAAGIVSTFVNLYPTAQARQAFAAQVASSPAETALLGPVYTPTLGGLVACR
jgi:ABC-2 type transport system permease protein